MRSLHDGTPRALAISVLSLILVGAGGFAPQTAAAQAEASDDPRAQLQEVQQKLAPIQQEAMQDSALFVELSEVQASVREAMEEIDPGTTEREERLNNLRTQLQAAQQEQDTATLRSLMVEAQRLQQENRQVQRQAMEQEDVAEELAAFRSQLESKMIEIDPQAEELLARQDSLVQVITGGESGGGG